MQLPLAPGRRWVADVAPSQIVMCVYLVEVVQGNTDVIMGVHVGPMQRLVGKFSEYEDDMCIYVAEPCGSISPNEVLRDMLRLHSSRVTVCPKSPRGQAQLAPRFIEQYKADLAGLVKGSLMIGSVGVMYTAVKQRELASGGGEEEEGSDGGEDEDGPASHTPRGAVCDFVRHHIAFDPPRPEGCINRKYFAYLSLKDVRVACVRWVAYQRNLNLYDRKIVKSRKALDDMIASAFLDVGGCKLQELRPFDDVSGKVLRIKGFNDVLLCPYRA